MIGMRVVEPDNVEASLTAQPLNLHQLLRRDLVSIVCGVGARIAGANRVFHCVRPGLEAAQQYPTALMRIGLLAVLAERVIDLLAQMQHRYSSSQKRSLRYLSAESGSTVTMTASRPAAASSSPRRRVASTAAAAEMPTSNPSVRPSRFAMA